MSEESSKVSVTFSLPFLQILFLIFVVLKLKGDIDWGWFLVFMPLILDIGFRVGHGIYYEVNKEI